MIKAIIFDMDGVLVDSLPAHLKAWQAFLKQHGVAYTKEDFAREIGPSTKELMAARITKHQLPLALDQAVEEKERLFEAQQPMLFPGVPETLRSLQKRYALGVATSADRTLASSVLGRTQIASCFQTLVGSDEVARAKPDPALFLQAANRLGIKPEACVVVEDSPRGIEAAKAAKMRVIGITTSFPKERLQQADVIIEHFAEIPQALERLHGDEQA